VGKQYETPEHLVSEVEILMMASARTFWRVSSNPGRKDCRIAEIPIVNMWSKLYILASQCLSNFARVRRVRVNNEYSIYHGSSTVARNLLFRTPQKALFNLWVHSARKYKPKTAGEIWTMPHLTILLCPFTKLKSCDSPDYSSRPILLIWHSMTSSYSTAWKKSSKR
jgi:hypothetical protein